MQLAFAPHYPTNRIGLDSTVPTVAQTISSSGGITRGLSNQINLMANGDLADYQALSSFLAEVFRTTDEDLRALVASNDFEHVGFYPATLFAVDGMIRDAQITNVDHFWDLGSGPGGRIVNYVHLRTGARCTGVEINHAFYSHACEVTSKLGIGGVDFINADASKVTFSSGTVFFMYAPFWGETLRIVLDNLKSFAHNTQIKICALACGQVLTKEGWLIECSADPDHGVRIFQSVKG